MFFESGFSESAVARMQYVGSCWLRLELAQGRYAKIWLSTPFLASVLM